MNGRPFDLRGNLAANSIWDTTFDDRNRLMSMEMTDDFDDDDRVKLEFEYDFAGRRAWKKVYVWDDDDWTDTPVVTKYIWSGWLLQAETDGSNNVLRSYVWGRDVAGDLDEGRNWAEISGHQDGIRIDSALVLGCASTLGKGPAGSFIRGRS